MLQENSDEHIPHNDPNVAYHMDWGFRREAAIWKDERPITANLRPIGNDLRKWLRREGTLNLYAHCDKGLPNALTNPYSYDASVLAIAYSDIVNKTYAFVHSNDETEPMIVEVGAIRLYSELVLYTARLCEALIKQLLYCTTFKRRDYRRATLGTLLTSECSGCRASDQLRHKISLLGSLAHRYNRCGEYENCLHHKLTIVRKRRNTETAHSGIIPFEGLQPAECRSRLKNQMMEIGDELIHMLEHIGNIETDILEEMHSNVDAENIRLNAEGIELLRSLGLIKEKVDRDAISRD